MSAAARQLPPESSEPPATPRERAVFVSDFVHLPLGFEELADHLLDPEFSWLEKMESCEGVELLDDDRASAAVHVGLTRRLGQLQVLVSAGPARLNDRHDRTIVMPLHWQPRQLVQLLPVLEADLVASELDDEYSRLELAGRYRVPLGELGASLDRAGLHRVAETAIRQFLRDVEQALLAP